jgi:hypothetical protein
MDDLKKKMDDLLSKDTEVELMQSKETNSCIVQCYNTSLCSAYQNDYMIVIKENNYNDNLYFAYFADLVDMFFYYDKIQS